MTVHQKCMLVLRRQLLNVLLNLLILMIFAMSVGLAVLLELCKLFHSCRFSKWIDKQMNGWMNECHWYAVRCKWPEHRWKTWRVNWWPEHRLHHIMYCTGAVLNVVFWTLNHILTELGPTKHEGAFAMYKSEPSMKYNCTNTAWRRPHTKNSLT